MTPFTITDVPLLDTVLANPAAVGLMDTPRSRKPVPAAYSAAKALTTKAAILTEMPVLAAGLASMLRMEGFEVSIYAGDPVDLLTCLPPGAPSLVILHGDAEASVKTAELISSASPDCILALWIEKITPQLAVQALEAGVRAVLSTKLSPESTLAALIQICGSDECQIRITADTLCRQSASPRLNPRERQILRLVMTAAKNKEIAYQLRLTESTVKVYLNRLFRKAGVASRFELAQWAAEALEGEGAEHWPASGKGTELVSLNQEGL